MDTYNSEIDRDNFQPGDWEKIYVLVRYWRSDMEFYLEDLQFLKKLVKKYSIWINRSNNSEEVNNMSAELQDIIKHGKELKQKMEAHQRKLTELRKEKSSNTEAPVWNEHEALEHEVAEFVKHFRVHRRKVFKVSEKVMDSENLSI